MSYEPKTWLKGQRIKASDLNHMEQGIAAAGSGGGGGSVWDTPEMVAYLGGTEGEIVASLRNYEFDPEKGLCNKITHDDPQTYDVISYFFPVQSILIWAACEPYDADGYTEQSYRAAAPCTLLDMSSIWGSSADIALCVTVGSYSYAGLLHYYRDVETGNWCVDSVEGFEGHRITGPWVEPDDEDEG